MTWNKARLLATVLAIAFIAPAAAATWAVGPARELKTVARALELARDDDVIEVQPGTYRGDVAVIVQRRLTIRGVGARPVFTADGQHAEGKAIWVVRDGDITIDNIEFRGARVPDRNGAGIRFERGRLTLRRCSFFDNEMGLLTANFEDARLTIEDSEFGQAPHHAGALHHLLYVGRIASFSLTGSRLHGGYVGHLVKSRARESLIAHNTIVDGPLGSASYEIDLPNGGLARVIDNTIGQSADTENPVLVAYGAEGAAWPVSALTLEGNLLINDRTWGGTFLRVWRDRLPSNAEVLVRNNRLAGPGGLDAGAGARLEGNVHVPRP